MNKFWMIALTATATLAACTDDPDSGTTTAPSTTVADSISDSTTESTVPPTADTVVESYDETVRYPLDELPDRLAETIARQGGDPAVAGCVTDAILAAYDAGDLTAIDLDEYARVSTVTETMAAFLADLQATDTCAAE